MPAPEAFKPTLPVSVIIPFYASSRRALESLARTLAALERQTYPRELFEVVIVDDGSEPPLAQPRSTPLDVKVVRQEHCGCGTPRARNTGVRTASHALLLFLDSDMLAEAGWIAAHARWHHVVSDALTLGTRGHVAMDGIDAEMVRRRTGSLKELFGARPVDRSWVEEYLLRSNDLTSRADDLYSVSVGGNLGIRRHFYEQVGRFDESFVRWGLDDTEFGYRAYSRGGLLVPVRNAFAWHQGRWDEGRDSKRRQRRRQLGKAAHLIAHDSLRRNRTGRVFTVPQYLVTVDMGHRSAVQIIETVGTVLADPVHDLVVRIETQAGDDDDERLAWLRDEFGADPRVRVGSAGAALDEFPVASFHVRLPATYILGGIAMLFATGEEISWGQRIVGFSTPDFLINLNSQKEFNLHNILELKIHKWDTYGILMLCMVTCGAFFCDKKFLFGVPVPSFLLALGAMATTQFDSPGGSINPIGGIYLNLLILSLVIYVFISRRAELIIVSISSVALTLTITYLNSDNIKSVELEVYEYLTGIICMLLSIELLFAQESIQRKVATLFNGRKPLPYHLNSAPN